MRRRWAHPNPNSHLTTHPNPSPKLKPSPSPSPNRERKRERKRERNPSPNLNQAVLQRGVRGRLARRGLCEAVAAGAAIDARTCIRALLLREHAPKGGGVEWSLGLEWRLRWSEHGQRGCSGAADRVPGEQRFGLE